MKFLKEIRRWKWGGRCVRRGYSGGMKAIITISAKKKKVDNMGKEARL